MATIIKRDGKKGISYKIQVAIKDVGLGKTVTKSTTWKPQKGMTEKEIETACTIFAESFEKQVIDSFKTAENDKGNVNITFKALSEKWLERATKMYGGSYEGNASQSLEVVLPMIGGYKVKDITASIVQSVFDRIHKIEKQCSESYFVSAENALNKIRDIMDGYRLKDLIPTVLENIHKQIDEMQKIEYTIVAKDTLMEMIFNRYKSRSAFCRKCNLSEATVRDAMRKHKICYATASKIATALETDIETIFDIQKRVVPFKSAYREGMKKVIRCTLTEAARLGILDKNYARRLYITYKHPDAEKVQSMTIADAQKLMCVCNSLDIRKKLIISFLLCTGVRKGELCGLDWADIDFDNKTVYIRRQYEAVSKKGLVLKEPKTKSSIRQFELSDMLIDILREYRVWYDAKREEMGEDWQGEDNILVARNGKRLHPTTVRNWLDEALQLAGLPHCSVHSLRHTNITLLIASGVSPVTVAGRVGHTKVSTTMDIYADFLGSSDREASEKINAYFGNEIPVTTSTLKA